MSSTRQPGLTLGQLVTMLDQMREYLDDSTPVVVDAGGMTSVVVRPVTDVYTRGGEDNRGSVALCYDTVFAVGSERVR